MAGDETTKSAVIQAVLDKFEIGDDFHNDLQAQQIVNKKAYGLYKDWRYTLKQEFELLEGLPSDEIYAHPPLGVSLDDWKHLIDVAWQDASHQKQSKVGKSNRSQLSYNHTNGSRSFPIAIDAMEELSRQVLGQKKRYLLGFGSGPQPSTIVASRARDKDMEAMRAEVEGLREERQKDHDE
ncbi:hypothetical protein ACSBR2_025774 [Camellia fascicularis]